MYLQIPYNRGHGWLYIIVILLEYIDIYILLLFSISHVPIVRKQKSYFKSTFLSKHCYAKSFQIQFANCAPEPS